ncbi:MAG: SDR family oxidoreductase [Alphaproteobacteria bacterium]|nr:SDR family oxidoreductase [Alphaproteobacteria bacterium]
MVFQFLSDKWLNRRRKIDADSVAAVEGKSPAVVVTGGSRGIGLAIALQFAKRGHRVALVAINEARLAAASKIIHEATGQIPLTFRCDVGDPQAARRIGKHLDEHDCYLDILVNNAGVGIGGKLILQDIGEIENVIRTNIIALTRLTSHVLPEMLARGRGGVINVSSLGGLMPGPYEAVYYASKAYVVSFTRALASEVSGRGVRVSCVLPGPVKTDFHDALDREKRALYRRLLRWDTPELVGLSTYRGYRSGRKIIVPGVSNALLYSIIGFLPYALTVPVLGLLLDPRTSGTKPDQVHDGKLRQPSSIEVAPTTPSTDFASKQKTLVDTAN